MLINEVSKLSGVSKRTLRYYDEIALLKPTNLSEAGYRIYGQEDLNRLQQILFCRELGFSLKDIKALISKSEISIYRMYEDHREQLLVRRNKLDQMIQLIDQSMKEMKGEIIMTNEEKFMAFKDQLINENEKNYGREIREKHGEESVMAAYGKLKDMTEEQFEAVKQLENALFTRLKEAMEIGDTASDIAMEVAELHKRWLAFYWPKYTKEAHAGLVLMYISDERFITYYDGNVQPGATQFLYEIIMTYTKN